MMIARLAFPIVCFLTQTNALISLDLGVRLSKLLFIKRIDSRAAGIKNTWSNWKTRIHISNEILSMSSSICVGKDKYYIA